MSPLMEGLVTIATAITGVAIIAVLVSKNANTAAVIQSGASGFSNALDVAISPVTGATASPQLAYPGGGVFSSTSLQL
jgi:hypothetical protein